MTSSADRPNVTTDIINELATLWGDEFIFWHMEESVYRRASLVCFRLGVRWARLAINRRTQLVMGIHKLADPDLLMMVGSAVRYRGDVGGERRISVCCVWQNIDIGANACEGR